MTVVGHKTGEGCQSAWADSASILGGTSDCPALAGELSRASMKRLALLMLILALFAPRAAWAVHVGDHEPISAGSVAHFHAAEHSHEARATGALAAAGEQDRHQDDGDGLVHEHPPCILMAFAALLPDYAELAAPSLGRELVHDTVGDGIRLASLKLPDRPPRSA
jgi:hypothetical protein